MAVVTSDPNRPLAFRAGLLTAFAEPLIRLTGWRGRCEHRGARRGSISLNSLDDHMLKDIGFERIEIAAAALGYGSERFSQQLAAAGKRGRDGAANFSRIQSGR